MKYIILLIYTILANFGLLLMKVGANKGSTIGFINSTFNINISLYTILGFVMYIFSFILYLVLISKFDLTYLVPITSAISYIMIFTISILVLKEQMSIFQGIGFFTILAGLILLNIK